MWEGKTLFTLREINVQCNSLMMVLLFTQKIIELAIMDSVVFSQGSLIIIRLGDYLVFSQF
jgi:hypothetical protein